MEEAIQASKVHLLSTDHEDGGENTWQVPFDPSLKEVTISLSGPAPGIKVWDPTGRNPGERDNKVCVCVWGGGGDPLPPRRTSGEDKQEGVHQTLP